LRSSDPDSYARFVSWWDADEIAALTGRPPMVAPLYADILARGRAVARDARPGLLDVVSYLPEAILTKVDRASMAVSLEVRAPLLDHRVVEFALGLPLSLKRRGRSMKWLLRRLLYKRVPPALIDRPKMGFGVPLSDWFRGPLRERMESALAAGTLEGLGIEPLLVRRMWTDFLAGRTERVSLLWLIFMLVAWSREHTSGSVLRFPADPNPVRRPSVKADRR
jgi:asparagine synthase (glutamine-hydrolysing)